MCHVRDFDIPLFFVLRYASCAGSSLGSGSTRLTHPLCVAGSGRRWVFLACSSLVFHGFF